MEKDILPTVPDSWKILRDAMGKRRNYVAHVVRRARSQVDRWVVPPPTAQEPDNSGCINPLDMMVRILRACEEDRAQEALDWVCHHFHGHFEADAQEARDR